MVLMIHRMDGILLSGTLEEISDMLFREREQNKGSVC